MADRRETLVAAVAPVVAESGLGLYDVELVGTGSARTLRVSIEREGGVDLDAITAVTQALGPVLDAPDVASTISGPYTLEVSSPGLERPLRTAEHFQRALGTTVSVKARGADGAASRYRGVLVAADDAGLDLDVDGQREHLALDDVVGARTVFEWAPTPRPGKVRS